MRGFCRGWWRGLSLDRSEFKKAVILVDSIDWNGKSQYESLLSDKESMKKPIYIILVTLVLTHLPSQALERYEFYNGIRSLGMGGARIAVVNDETAVLVNPAGLGRLRDHFVTIVDPEVSYGTKTRAVVGADVLAIVDPSDMVSKLQDSEGNHAHVKAQVFPSLVFPNFGIGLLSKYEMNAEYDSTLTSPNNVRVHYLQEDALVMGFNFRLFDGRLKIGFNMRAVNRTHIDREGDSNAVDPAESLSIKSLAKEGFGVASDVGIIWTLPWSWLPTLSVVGRDMGNTNYEINNGLYHGTDERPDTTLQTVDAGFALYPLLGKRTRMTISAEMRDVLNAEQLDVDKEDVMRRVHAGMEINIADALFLRAGWHQRYWSGGAELAIQKFQFQFASYGDEIGTDSAPREDRRYVMKFSFRL